VAGQDGELADRHEVGDQPLHRLGLDVGQAAGGEAEGLTCRAVRGIALGHLGAVLADGRGLLACIVSFLRGSLSLLPGWLLLFFRASLILRRRSASDHGGSQRWFHSSDRI